MDLTFDSIDLDTLADIHHFDEGRPFFDFEGIVNLLLIADAGPVVCHGAVCIPADILVVSIMARW